MHDRPDWNASLYEAFVDRCVRELHDAAADYDMVRFASILGSLLNGIANSLDAGADLVVIGRAARKIVDVIQSLPRIQ